MDVNGEDASATKGDLRLVHEGMRAELKSVEGRLDQRIGDVHRTLAIEIVKTHERIDRVESNLRGDFREFSSRILKTVEDFMTQVGKTDRAQIIADWRLSELEKRVATIESRPS
jgi:hypothetical protein